MNLMVESNQKQKIPQLETIAEQFGFLFVFCLFLFHRRHGFLECRKIQLKIIAISSYLQLLAKL